MLEMTPQEQALYYDIMYDLEMFSRSTMKEENFMPEILGQISRFNGKGYEVVIQRPMGKLERIRCSHNLWQNFLRDFKQGDFVQVEYTLVGEDEIKVARSMVKREDLRG